MACRIVMALPAVVSFAVVSAGSTPMAVVNAGLCTDGDASCKPAVSSLSSASTEESAEVWLLQVAAARTAATPTNLDANEATKLPDQEDDTTEESPPHKPPINMTKMFEDLKVVTRVDKLKTAMQTLSNGNITEHMRKRLYTAWNNLPLVEHVKNMLSHQQWANISDAADAEDSHQDFTTSLDSHSGLLEIKSDSAEASELHRQLENLSGPFSDVTIADVQDQVADMWNDLQGHSFSFPTLDNFTAHAGDVVKILARIVKDPALADEAKEAMNGVVEDTKEIVSQ